MFIIMPFMMYSQYIYSFCMAKSIYDFPVCEDCIPANPGNGNTATGKVQTLCENWITGTKDTRNITQKRKKSYPWRLQE